MSQLKVDTITDEAGTGATDFPNGASVAGNNLPTGGPLAGFRNAIINGNFDIWQRGTSFSGAQYGADRWINNVLGSSPTQSRQAFALGQTDVPNEPEYFARTVVSSVAGAGNIASLQHRVEGVRVFAGQTVTLSFWAKADAAKNIAVELQQNFGGGGSPSATVFGIGGVKYAIGTAWQKLVMTVAVPSISGKTLGTDGNDRLVLNIIFDAGSDFDARTNSLGHQSGTFDIAQVQLEAGSVATPFERRPVGTELALCQRYYWESTNTNLTGAWGAFYSNTAGRVWTKFTQQMRAVPALSYSNLNFDRVGLGGSTAASISGTIVDTQGVSFDGIGLPSTTVGTPLGYMGIITADAEI